MNAPGILILQQSKYDGVETVRTCARRTWSSCISAVKQIKPSLCASVFSVQGSHSYQTIHGWACVDAAAAEAAVH